MRVRFQGGQTTKSRTTGTLIYMKKTLIRAGIDPVTHQPMLDSNLILTNSLEFLAKIQQLGNILQMLTQFNKSLDMTSIPTSNRQPEMVAALDLGLSTDNELGVSGILDAIPNGDVEPSSDSFWREVLKLM